MTSPEAGTAPANDGRNDPIHRPNPLRWIAYAYGARLPERNRSWVYNDLTGRFAVPVTCCAASSASCRFT